MLFDFAKSTIDNIRERVKNPFHEKNTTPFAGAFIIALVLFNWKLFFSLFFFNETETRIDRIKIIHDYLLEKSWIERIGYPILYAFFSITLFYLFNYISLGLTTFFNRWVKATILHFTDRSKIVTREELEKTMRRTNIIRKNYEEQKQYLDDMISVVEEQKTEIKNRDKQITDIYIEKDELAEQLKKSNEYVELHKKETFIARQETSDLDKLLAIEIEEKKKFKIIYAKYGLDDQFNEVTDRIENMIDDYTIFRITNSGLGPDPSIGKKKQAQIIYQINNKYNSLYINEFDYLKNNFGSLSIIKNNDIVIELQTLVTNNINHRANSWIYEDDCLVYDYTINNFQIAIDILVVDEMWEIQLLGRNERSESFLFNDLIKAENFIDSTDTYEVKNKRFIFGKFNEYENIYTIAEKLLILIRRIEAYKNIHD